MFQHFLHNIMFHSFTRRHTTWPNERDCRVVATVSLDDPLLSVNRQPTAGGLTVVTQNYFDLQTN